jgi:hypothetical protein
VSFPVAAGRAFDASGNLNAPSTSADDDVTHDDVAPAVTPRRIISWAVH